MRRRLRPRAVRPPNLSGRSVRYAAAFVAALALAGCATAPPAPEPSVPRPPASAPPTPRAAEPPPPNVNLSGFPLPYRQGYADGCASAGGREQKDAARFGSDDNYRLGWFDGRSICARR